MALGIIGEYLARMFIEVKQRPLYLVARKLAPARPLPAAGDGAGRRTPGKVMAVALTAARTPRPRHADRVRRARAPRDARAVSADGLDGIALRRNRAQDARDRRLADAAVRLRRAVLGQAAAVDVAVGGVDGGVRRQRIRRAPAVVRAARRLRRARRHARRDARRPRPGAVDARAVRTHRARVHRRGRRHDRPRARCRHDAVDGRLLGRARGPDRYRSRRPASRSSRASPSVCSPRDPSPSCSRSLPIGACGRCRTRQWRAVWQRLPWISGTAVRRRARRPVVLGRRARDAGISRLLPRRRALEALSSSRAGRATSTAPRTRARAG